MNQYQEFYLARVAAAKSVPANLSKKEGFTWLTQQQCKLFDTYSAFSSFTRRMEMAEETLTTAAVTPSFTPPITPSPQGKDYQNTDWQDKILTDKGIFKTLWFSDPHGWLNDPKSTGVINKVLQANKFDEVGINGDITDLPFISKHTAKLYEDGVLSGYSEIKEIEHTKAAILEPLRASTDAPIRVRIGNHDERITKPGNLSHSQNTKLLGLIQHYNTSKYDEMLGLNGSQGFIYDPSDMFTYFDVFDVVHGLSLQKSASRKNIGDYFSSGGSGHTHRLGATYVTNRKGNFVWVEMGCTRLLEKVEYLPTATIADWQSGFVELTFYKVGNKTYFFVEPHVIIEGMCKYNGVVYRWDK